MAPGPGQGPLFSVVTVCYNDGTNLEKTAASVLGQEFASFEWLVVDGNSKDGTREFLRTIVDARTSWTSEDDRGLFDAMNKGMDRARGEYLMFMNSGDTFCGPGTLGMVAAAIGGAQVRPAFIYGDSIDCTAGGREYYRRAKSHRLHWRGQFTQHQAMFFRRTPLRYDPGYRVTADYAFIGRFLQAIADPAAIVRLDRPVCRFLLGGVNEAKRFTALAEDYRIRRHSFGMSAWSSGLLFALHYVHAVAKRFVPSLVYGSRRLSQRLATVFTRRRST
jgi:putative colanic acid biosynthesis glycosyltransferase